ncbi:MAG TPA: IclR family transcriptional regulator C-terminal domain-containing protein [Chthoniobacterales bacterium]|nr:IclR family transcriptional regulator C-terminal domain-containing protein [Chthoniobacterales bacterium]
MRRQTVNGKRLTVGRTQSDTAGTLKKLSLVLEQFDLEHPVLSLAELTRLTRLPKTSVFRVLKVAVEIDLLSAAADGYRPSLRLFELGMIAREGLSFGAHLNRVVESLAEELGETVLAATLEGKELLYLSVAEPKRALRVAAPAGFRRELLFGATGLTLLANLPVETWSSYLPKKLPRYTRRTIIDRAKFLRRLRQVRQDGYMIEHGEYTEELVGMAVPVSWKDALHRRSPLVLVAVAPETRIDRKRALTVILTLQKAAAELVR